MDALILLLVVVGLIAFEVLAMRFGVDSRDRMTTRRPHSPCSPTSSVVTEPNGLTTPRP